MSSRGVRTAVSRNDRQSSSPAKVQHHNRPFTAEIAGSIRALDRAVDEIPVALHNGFPLRIALSDQGTKLRQLQNIRDTSAAHVRNCGVKALRQQLDRDAELEALVRTKEAKTAARLEAQDEAAVADMAYRVDVRRQRAIRAVERKREQQFDQSHRAVVARPQQEDHHVAPRGGGAAEKIPSAAVVATTTDRSMSIVQTIGGKHTILTTSAEVSSSSLPPHRHQNTKQLVSAATHDAQHHHHQAPTDLSAALRVAEAEWLLGRHHEQQQQHLHQENNTTSTNGRRRMQSSHDQSQRRRFDLRTPTDTTATTDAAVAEGEYDDGRPRRFLQGTNKSQVPTHAERLAAINNLDAVRDKRVAEHLTDVSEYMTAMTAHRDTHRLDVRNRADALALARQRQCEKTIARSASMMDGNEKPPGSRGKPNTYGGGEESATALRVAQHLQRVRLLEVEQERRRMQSSQSTAERLLHHWIAPSGKH